MKTKSALRRLKHMSDEILDAIMIVLASTALIVYYAIH